MGLDLAEIMMAVEDVFDIVIPEGAIIEPLTVGGLCDYVHAWLQEHEFLDSPYTRNRQAIWDTLKQIVVDHLDVPESDVTEDAHFIRDLDCG